MSFDNRMLLKILTNLHLIKLTLPVISEPICKYKQRWQPPQK
jgi:hypothetical protein